MALTEPLDLLTGFPGWSTDFSLTARQEQSRHGSGRTRVKDFGSPIWRASWTTGTLPANALDMWRARIEQAMISQMTFRAWQSSRCWPIAHPNGRAVDLRRWVLESGFWNNAGVWRTDVPWGANGLPTDISLFDIGDDNQTVRLAGAGFLRLSVGDMVQIGDRDLHRVLEPVEGDTTGFFTITPHVWPGAAPGQTVTVHKPSCLMTIDPGSLSAPADPRTGRGSISFSAMEAR